LVWSEPVAQLSKVIVPSQIAGCFRTETISPFAAFVTCDLVQYCLFLLCHSETGKEDGLPHLRLKFFWHSAMSAENGLDILYNLVENDKHKLIKKGRQDQIIRSMTGSGWKPSHPISEAQQGPCTEDSIFTASRLNITNLDQVMQNFRSYLGRRDQLGNRSVPIAVLPWKEMLTSDGGGDSPLHVVCLNECGDAPDMARALLIADPSLASVRAPPPRTPHPDDARASVSPLRPPSLPVMGFISFLTSTFTPHPSTIPENPPCTALNPQPSTVLGRCKTAWAKRRCTWRAATAARRCSSTWPRGCAACPRPWSRAWRGS